MIQNFMFASGQYSQVKAYLACPKGMVTNIIYFQCAPEHTKEIAVQFAEELKTVLDETNAALAVVEVPDWNRDLSPWKAEKVFAKGQDFAGGANRYLDFWNKIIIPSIECNLMNHNRMWIASQTRDTFMQTVEISGLRRSIGGYSMAGLFAIYMGVNTDLFSDIISVSGSLWYDGLINYLNETDISKTLKNVYLSIGDQEKKTKNPRMAKIEQATCQIAEIFRSKEIAVQFEINAGNHFDDAVERMKKGILFVLT